MKETSGPLSVLQAKAAALESCVAEGHEMAAAGARLIAKARAELAAVTREIEALRQPDDLVTLKEAAYLAQRCERTVRRWAARGLGVKRGGQWFLQRSACIGGRVDKTA